MNRTLEEIAKEIRKDWKNPFYGAVPYIAALQRLKGIDDTCGAESAKSIILYFLSNAVTWRGPVARVIKAELRQMVK